MHRLNSAYITVLRAETKKVYRSAKEIRDIYAVNAELRRYDHNGEYQRYEEQTDDLRRASLDLQKLMGYPKDSQWYGKSINYSVDKYLRESPYREEVRDKLVEQMQDYAAKPYLSNCPMVARYIASKQAAMNDHAAMDGLVELAQDRADCQQMSFNNHYYSKCMREIKKKNND